MAYRVVSNKLNGPVTLLVTSNSTITVVGGGSVIALEGENIEGAAINKIWPNSPSFTGGYWEIKRGANTVFIADCSSFIDLFGNGNAITKDKENDLIINRIDTTEGTLNIELSKIY
jgi:hypothetical protein